MKKGRQPRGRRPLLLSESPDIGKLVADLIGQCHGYDLPHYSGLTVEYTVNDRPEYRDRQRRVGDELA